MASRTTVVGISAVLAAVIVAVPFQSVGAGAQGGPGEATFYRDVLPVLQDNCQTCHRPGEMAPMSFMTYEETRPWARAIGQAVSNRQMPPWFADTGHRPFLNDRTLSERELHTLIGWIEGGAPAGDPADAPARRTWVDGWNLEPDMIVEMPVDFPVPAEGTINYQNVKVKVDFPEDVWVTAAEMRAGNREVVHHMRANVIPPDAEYMKDAEYGVAYENGDPILGERDPRVDLLGKYNPGLGAQDFAVFESAKFVPAGSDIVFNLHYTAVGKATTDRSRVGLVFSKEPPRKRYYVSEGPTALNLAIPAGDRNAQVVSELTTTAPMELVYLQPHMHLRGKDMEFQLHYPDGGSETVFKGVWNFDWQLGYELEKPIAVPVGTRMVVIAHYDNSAANRFNPDPTELVFWGPQNWHEMQNCFIGVLIDPAIDPASIFEKTGPSLLPRGTSGPTLAALAD
jgi:hypothetical protein